MRLCVCRAYVSNPTAVACVAVSLQHLYFKSLLRQRELKTNRRGGRKGGWERSRQRVKRETKMRRWRRYGERKRETKISEGEAATNLRADGVDEFCCKRLQLERGGGRRREKDWGWRNLLLCYVLVGNVKAGEKKVKKEANLSAGRYQTHTDTLIPFKSYSHYMGINTYMHTCRHARCLDRWYVLNGWNNPRFPYDRPLMRHSSMVGALFDCTDTTRQTWHTLIRHNIMTT